ncbi:hypothetical protein PMIN06_002765 [Paraphaeosphaeria minitans]
MKTNVEDQFLWTKSITQVVDPGLILFMLNDLKAEEKKTNMIQFPFFRGGTGHRLSPGREGKLKEQSNVGIGRGSDQVRKGRVASLRQMFDMVREFGGSKPQRRRAASAVVELGQQVSPRILDSRTIERAEKQT